MDIKTFLNKTKYSISAFLVLAMPSLIFDGFESAVTSACRLLLCAGVALFLSSYLNEQVSTQKAVLPAFLMLSIISCNAIFLTDDIHILLSLLSFFIALFFNEKNVYLTPLFAGLCVMAQPLTILILVPTIVTVQLIKNQKRLALLSVALSVAFFIITTLFEHSEFYANQYTSYYLSLHLIHFSKTHTQTVMQYLVYNLPLIAVAFAYLTKLFLNGKKTGSLALLFSILLSVIGFAMSENTHTVFMILIPVFAAFISIDSCEKTKKTNAEIAGFFTNNLIVFLLIVALTAALPMILGHLPFESELFSDSTFIIFKEE